MTVAPTVADRLAAEALRIGALPPAALPWHDLGSVLIDTLAVASAGAGEELVAAARRELGTPAGPARVWGTTIRTDALQATLLNGIAAHVLELDDIYAPGTVHPGSVIIPAALAAADEAGADGVALARAVTAGYEVCGRLAADLGPSHYRLWHTTGTAGAVGAGAAAALLLDPQVDATTMRDTLTLAATMSGGLQQLFRAEASGKPLHAGHAAMAGVIAAKTARAGIGGTADMLEGPAGMAAAMSGSGTWDYSTGERAEFCVEATTVKPYPCCGHAFAAIDAALELRGQLVGPDTAVGGAAVTARIADITVDTYLAGVEVAGIAMPKGAADTRFSIPFLVALALSDGAVARSELTPDRLADPAFAALVGATTVCLDDVFEAAFPTNRGARVTIATADGQTLSATVPNRSGSPENPLTPEALRAKFDTLLAHLPAAERDVLHGQLADLAGLRTVADLALPASTPSAPTGPTIPTDPEERR